MYHVFGDGKKVLFYNISFFTDVFPASGIGPSYTRHLISGSRHCFFMIFIRSWCHMDFLLYSSHSSTHGHMRTLYNTKYFQSFYHLLFAIYHLHLSSAYFYPAARDRIFFTRRLTSGSRRDLFLYFSMFIIHD